MDSISRVWVGIVPAVSERRETGGESGLGGDESGCDETPTRSHGDAPLSRKPTPRSALLAHPESVPPWFGSTARKRSNRECALETLPSRVEIRYHPRMALHPAIRSRSWRSPGLGLLSFAFMVLPVLAACGSEADSSATTTPFIAVADPEVLSPELVLAVSDGLVTFEEYEAGFLRFQDCVTNLGFPVNEVVFDEARQLFSYIIPDGGDPTGEVNGCYESQFGEVDANWQISPDRPRAGYESMSIQEIIIECLQLEGAETSETEGLGLDELQALLPKYDLDVDFCYLQAQELHP